MSLNQFPSVTVVIPTLNAMTWFYKSWDIFTCQEYEGKYEILIIDSGSADGTVEFCMSSSSHTRVITIDSAEFGHGRTRNLALEHTDAELIIFTVQDACPPSSEWIALMVEDLVNNDLAALCGGQATPHDWDKNPVEWFRPIDNNATPLIIDGGELGPVSNEELFRYCGWDNVNAVYRRSALTAFPFQEVPFGEDMRWAKEALKNKLRIGYSYNNRVWHYHHRDYHFAYKRAAYDAYWRFKNFGILPTSRKNRAISEWLKILHTITIKSGIFNPKSIGYWIRYNHRLHQAIQAAHEDLIQAINTNEYRLNEWYINLGVRSPMHSKSSK